MICALILILSIVCIVHDTRDIIEEKRIRFLFRMQQTLQCIVSLVIRVSHHKRVL